MNLIIASRALFRRPLRSITRTTRRQNSTDLGSVWALTRPLEERERSARWTLAFAEVTPRLKTQDLRLVGERAARKDVQVRVDALECLPRRTRNHRAARCDKKRDL